jgi:hypothetical protein
MKGWSIFFLGLCALNGMVGNYEISAICVLIAILEEVSTLNEKINKNL